MINRVSKPEIRNMERPDLNRYALEVQREHRNMLKDSESKLSLYKSRVSRKDELIKRLRYEVFTLNRRLYAQKLRMSKDKTTAKRTVYETAINNVVNKRSELIDIPKYHMALFELSNVFDKPEMYIILLLWASRYEYYSKREFRINFKDSPINFEKYNMMLVRDGYTNRWEQKRSSYFISASGKELVEKINKFVYKRLNG